MDFFEALQYISTEHSNIKSMLLRNLFYTAVTVIPLKYDIVVFSAVFYSIFKRLLSLDSVICTRCYEKRPHNIAILTLMSERLYINVLTTQFNVTRVIAILNGIPPFYCLTKQKGAAIMVASVGKQFESYGN